MKIEGYKIPKSSFLSIEKDLNIIIDKMLKNERLKRLLKYTTKDCMRQKNLTLIHNNIKIIPKMIVDNSVLNYIIIHFNNFSPNTTNPEFRDNIIAFDIVCHYDQWLIDDGQLRPYRIAAELDSMFNNQHLTGIGTLTFIGAHYETAGDEYACLTLTFSAIHGGEDKAPFINPIAQEQFEKEFEAMLKAK